VKGAALALALLLLAVPGAQAAFFPGVAVDQAIAAGDVDLAPGGGGAFTYLKGEGGVAHVFASTLKRGAPGPPQRVDAGQALESSQPRVAAANGGRALVVWVNDGKLWGSLRPAAGAPFSPPVLAYAPSAGVVLDPTLSMTINGKAYASFATTTGDARGAYMAADGSWSAPDAPLDVDPAQTASGPTVAASGDGTAMYAWTETGADGFTHVFLRRGEGARLSSVASEASVPSLDFRAGGNADSPSVGIELDSARAWVAFRQDFNDGGTFTSRAIGRRLLGSSFDAPPFAVDGLSFPAGAGADHARVALTGRGRGTFTASFRAPAGVTGMLLKNDVLGPVRRLDMGASNPVPTAADDGTGTVVWQRGSVVVGRHMTVAKVEPPANLSMPVGANAGLDSSGDANGDAAITFAQGDVVMLALFDAPPRSPHAHDEKRWQRNPRPRFHWSTVTDAWSKRVTYRIQIDKKTVVTTTRTTWVPRRPIPNGDHRWRIVTIDGRGQQTISHDRHLRIRAG
jgi:hypothetical protein